MNRVKIGWSKRETSLNEGVALFGQMHLRVAEGILDPLYTTALVIDGGEGHVIFVTCDLEAHRADSISATIERVTKLRPEISPDSILMGVTHSHTASSILPTPEVSPDGKSVYSGDKFRERLIEKSVEAIVEAWDTRAEGGIAYGYGYAVVGHSRRVCYDRDMSIGQDNRGVAPNGHAMMYGKTSRPEFSHYEAGADHFLNVLYTFDTENKVTGILMNVPCPSQLYEYALLQSSDYWNDVREAVKAEFGENVYVMPQCAAAGDLSPRILHYGAAQKRRLSLKYGTDHAVVSDDRDVRTALLRKDATEQIMNGVKEVLTWASTDIKTELPVKAVRRAVDIRRRFITDEEKAWCEETLEIMKNQLPSPDSENYSFELTRYNSFKNRNNGALRRYAEQEANPTFRKYFCAARVGDVSFVTSPYETFMDYMHRIQARSPFMQTFVIQLAGDAGASYMATERAMANKGYSASIFCNQVGAEGGQQFVENALEMLSELAD